MKVHDYLDISHTLAKSYFIHLQNPFDILPHLGEIIMEIGRTLSIDYNEIKPRIWVHATAKIADSASINAPCIIGKNTEVRHAAFIRGAALIGENCVVGNSTELKNCILFDGVQVPHYNYVGDSILGYLAHLGGGAVTANVKSDKTDVTLHTLSGDISTGMKKMGAIVGDHAEIGSHAVLAPGAIVGRNTTVYPLTFVRGEIPADSILKTGNSIIKKRNSK